LFPAFAAALLLAACSAREAPDSDAVSAAVGTAPLRRGELPDIVTAYGTAGPAADAVQVLNVPAAGQVLHWDVAPGSPVKRGQRLATFALAPSAVAAYRQAATALELATSQRSHVARLFEQRLATRDQLDQADKAWRDARSGLDALVRPQGRAATLEVAAPFDGTVAALSVAQGDALQPGVPLLSVQRDGGLVVVAGVERAEMARVRPGAPVALVPLDGGAPMHGRVRRLARVLDPRTRQLDVEVAPDGPPLAGEGFRADITVGRWQGWLLPRDALQGEEGHRYVFQVAGGKAVRVPVEVLGESDAVSVASGDLDPGRPLVTNGAAQLDDGRGGRVAGTYAGP
jgi:RND family efflux transporter MFP subunit